MSEDLPKDTHDSQYPPPSYHMDDGLDFSCLPQHCRVLMHSMAAMESKRTQKNHVRITQYKYREVIESLIYRWWRQVIACMATSPAVTLDEVLPVFEN